VWKAKLTGKLFGSELSDALPNWGDTTELMLSDQSQVPYPALVPDLTSSAKRSTLYGTLFKAGGGDGGIVKCSGREGHEAACFAQYDAQMTMCNSVARHMGGLRAVARCKERAFEIYQECRGY
jgi:hypothetical protein